MEEGQLVDEKTSERDIHGPNALSPLRGTNPDLQCP